MARYAAWVMTVAAGVAFFVAGIGAQMRHTATGQWPGAAGLEIVQLRPNFYVIAGSGAHIGVSIGAVFVFFMGILPFSR